MVHLQVVLSPAKTLNFEPVAVTGSVPVGSAKADAIAALLAGKTTADMRSILGCSAAIADTNRERFDSWSTAPSLPAILAYDGMAYDRLRGRDLSESELQVANSRLVVCSGLFGPVRALDNIKPYRLEMACKKLPAPYNNLATFWKETCTRAVLDGFGEGDKILVNAASQEYAAALDFKELEAQGVTVVNVDFTQASGKRQPTVHLKYGRGLITRYIITHDVDNLEDLKGFDLEDYVYDDAASTDTCVTFKQKGGEPAAKKRRTTSRK